MTYRLLDLFCGAGGAAMGYYRAGFDVVGVDIRPQPRFPFRFIQADALEYPLDGFDVVHASPPCQRYSTVTGRNRRKHPDLVAATRDRLAEVEVFVIENVIGAPLCCPFMLCGSSFGLDVRRHRHFECSHLLFGTPECNHGWQSPRFRSLDSRQEALSCVVGVHGHLNYPGELALRRRAMGIDWMTNAEITQAIPPAYTEWIGTRLIELLGGGV